MSEIPSLEHFDQAEYDREVTEGMHLPVGDQRSKLVETMEAINLALSSGGTDRIFPRIEKWYTIGIAVSEKYVLETANSSSLLAEFTQAPIGLASGRVEEFAQDAAMALADLILENQEIDDEIIDILRQEQTCCMRCEEPMRKASDPPYFWETEGLPLCASCYTKENQNLIVR